MKKRFPTLVAAAAVAAVALASWLYPGRSSVPKARAAEKTAKPVDAAALKRTRKQVKMLDDLYKTAVVLITKHYVTEDSSLPAGTAAIALFDAMKKKGWHEVRLLDVAGEPIEEKNTARDDFEKQAVKAMKSGKSYYEQVVHRKGKPYLRAATPIPVVLKKCTMCHENYKKAKKGEAIGALSYTLPIE